jgi:hypothetical protein
MSPFANEMTVEYAAGPLDRSRGRPGSAVVTGEPNRQVAAGARIGGVAENEPLGPRVYQQPDPHTLLVVMSEPRKVSEAISSVQ